MRKVTGLKIVALLAVLSMILVLGCTSGVAQQEYDAVKQELTGKEQELASAKQQVTSLQQQLNPAAPREPKRLEAKITVEMGETPSEMFFASSEGVKGGPFRLPAGKTVGMHFVNKGEEEHEVMFGRKVMLEKGEPHGYETSLFERLPADVFIYPSGKKVEVATAGKLDELELEAGADLWIRMDIPADLKGEWEIGCFIKEPDKKSHYDQGMKAKFIVE